MAHVTRQLLPLLLLFRLALKLRQHARKVDNCVSNEMASAAVSEVETCDAIEFLLLAHKNDCHDANELLLLATENDCLRGVKVALKAGADIDYEQVDNEFSSSGTALFTACQMGHVDILKLLLRKGASVAKRVADSAFAPLHAAAMEGRTEVVELLVQHGATLDIRDGFQNTPLMDACAHNHVDTVRRLIELGARPDLTDGYIAQRLGKEPGYLAGCKESIKLIQEARKTKLLRCCNPKCGKPGYRKTGTLKLCAQCKMTRYCSRDCQKQHWSGGHKKCCGQDAYIEEGSHPYQKVFKFMKYSREHAEQQASKTCTCKRCL